MSESPLPDGIAAELGKLAPAPARRLLSDWFYRTLREFLRLGDDAEIAPRHAFLELGFDSLMAVDFKDLLGRDLERALPSTLLFDHPTPAAVLEHLAKEVGLTVGPSPPEPSAPTLKTHTEDIAQLGLEELRALASHQAAALEAQAASISEPIAIVGMACRFPGGADDPDEFWRLTIEGRDAITEVPRDRFDVDAFYDADREAPGKMYTRYGGFLDRIDTFDAGFFGISPREAAQLDPQQRLLLETGWHALENAGVSPDELAGQPVGVFVGIRASEYFDSQCDRLPEDAESYYATGNAISTAAGRLSFTLGLTGPCFALDTACSSSLVAVHQALRSLRNGECSAALVGGVNLIIDPISTISICKANMLAADGRCKTFDLRADGYGRAEGCGMVLLERWSDARARGHRILALLRGSAINQDGASGGLTVPHGPAQEAVIRLALHDGRLEPGEIDYIEAHGTGTSLGDPIEVGALDAVFGDSHRDRKLQVASVKTNIGHLECAAGIAGLIKVVQSLRNECIPPHLHLERRNPHISWERTVVEVPTASRPWPRSERPRVAGVSSFGFSGTNAHVLVQEAPPEPEPERKPSSGPHVLLLSAHDDAGLQTRAQALAAWLRDNPTADLDAVCATAALGRRHLPLRQAVFAGDRDGLLGELDRCGTSAAPGVRGVASPDGGRVAFLFTGQGAQHPGMGKLLYQREQTFRDALDECLAALEPHLPQPLLDVMWADDGLLHQTEFTQPALFAVEYALASLLRSWGVEPSCMLGHSVGEYAAACLAKVFSLEDAARLIAARGRLMKELTLPGAMAVVFAGRDRVAPMLEGLEDAVAVAACNGPANTVVSGDRDTVHGIVERLQGDGVGHQLLEVSRAFHSPLMAPMLEPFLEVAQQIRYQPPEIPIISLLDPAADPDALARPEYWVDHVRRPVLFEEGVSTLLSEASVLVEVGPQPVLLGMARRFVEREGLAHVPTLQRNVDDVANLRRTAAALHVTGVSVDWRAVRGERPFSRLPLPGYPFQRQRYWLRGGGGRGSSLLRCNHPLLGRRVETAVLGDDELLFEVSIAEDRPAWVADHRVFGQALVPGAAFLDMALGAGAAAFGTEALELRGVAVQAPLAAERDATAVQIHLRPDGPDHTFEIFSLRKGVDDAESEWVLHAKGVVARGDVGAKAMVDLDQWRQSCHEPVDVEEFYSSFASVGLEYGPSFSAVTELSVGDGQALARIAVSEDLDTEGHLLHPALLDACFQTTAVAVSRDGLGETWLPLGVERAALHRLPKGTVHCRATLRQRAGDGRGATIVDVDLADDRGNPVATISGLQLVQARPESLLGARGNAVERLLYDVDWSRSRRESSDSPPDGSGTWLLVGDDAALAGALERAGGNAVVDDDTATLEALSAGVRGVLLLADETATAKQLCTSALRLVQSLVQQQPVPRLWLVTRGAQPAGAPAPLAYQQSALWGFANVVALEHGELQVTCIDRDPRRPGNELDMLATELCAPDSERQVAFRDGERFVARLRRRAELAGLELPDGPFSLRIPEYGVLDRLTLVPLERRAPGAGEVEIAVDAAALNFKDVLHALGMLREFSERQGILTAADQPFGFECSGRVAAVGPDVGELSVGDAVLASVPGCMASHVTVSAAAVCGQPGGLTSVQAAAVQTVFLTALYALERLAKVQSGETVLLHAAAGGVGQAALQLCQRRGCRVIATASSGKHDWLRRQGVEHVFDSRSLAFADQVMEATGGRGVDVVLNCLSGDAIAASVRALAEGGRFVEIGKLDIWTQERMREQRADVNYWSFDLADTFADDPALLTSLLADLQTGFAEGSLKPLPTTVFPLQHAPQAFTYLSQARNIGKVVLQVTATPEPAKTVRDDRCYLVTGGLGALGRLAARWLVEEGARHLLLVGRSQPTEEARAELTALGDDVKIELLTCDIADRQQVSDLLSRGRPPLGGVIHAAGVLDDSTMLQGGAERLATVLAPKVDGAVNLHEATLSEPLDFFVLYSSMAALLGNAGQCAYAAGNAVMDALAHHRRALGLPATSIQWGPWSGAGMAAAVRSRNEIRFAEIGLTSIAPELGMQVLARVIGESAPVAAVLPVKWSRYARQFRGGLPPLLSLLTTAKPTTAADSALLAELRAAPVAERRGLLEHALRQQLASVLGFSSASDIDAQKSFPDLGVDSLMAVELRSRLEGSLGCSLPATLLFDRPNLAALAAHLADEVLAGGETAPEGQVKAESVLPSPDDQREAETRALAELSDDELARRLAEQIRTMSEPEESDS